MSLIADALRAAERDRAARESRDEDLAPTGGENRPRGSLLRGVLGPLAIATLTAAATAGLVLWIRNHARDS